MSYAAWTIIGIIGSATASGIVNYAMYRLQGRDKTIKELSERLIKLELKFAAHTGKVNGGSYRTGD